MNNIEIIEDFLDTNDMNPVLKNKLLFLANSYLLQKKSYLDSLREKDEEFIHANRKIWEKGFEISDYCYAFIKELLTVEVDAFFADETKDKYADSFYTFIVLSNMLARGLQQYLEINTLNKNGLVDGAHARTRSLLELMICASFIAIDDASNEIAKAYIYTKYEDNSYEWAKVSKRILEILKKPNKRVSIGHIQKCSEISFEKTNDLYEDINKLNHADPAATFNRAAHNPTDIDGFSWRNSKGINMTASNAIQALTVIARYFLRYCPGRDLNYESNLLLALRLTVDTVYNTIAIEQSLQP